MCPTPEYGPVAPGGACRGEMATNHCESSRRPAWAPIVVLGSQTARKPRETSSNKFGNTLRPYEALFNSTLGCQTGRTCLKWPRQAVQSVRSVILSRSAITYDFHYCGSSIDRSDEPNPISRQIENRRGTVLFCDLHKAEENIRCRSCCAVDILMIHQTQRARSGGWISARSAIWRLYFDASATKNNEEVSVNYCYDVNDLIFDSQTGTTQI